MHDVYGDTRLRMDQAEGKSWVVTSTKADGTPEPLTGATVWFTAKRRLTDDDAAAVITKSTTTTGVAIVDGPGGIARIELAPADTAGMGPTTLYYDVRAKDGAGAIRRLARGRLFIRPGVRKATA